MANLLAGGDFRIGSVDVKVGTGSGQVPSSTAAVGPWSLNVDEHDAASNKYVRVRNILVSAAVAAGKVTEPPAEVIGDYVLLFDAEAGSLGASRLGFAEVQQPVANSPKALSNSMTELNLFVYSAVAGTFGVVVQNINVYATGTIGTTVVSEAVQLVAGWNRIRRVFLHPNVLDTDPIKGAYVSGEHLITLAPDQGPFSNVNINQNVTIAITGVYFGPANAEFNRVEEITRQRTIDLAETTGIGVPAGGSTGQILNKNSGTSFDTGWVTNHPVPAGGTTGQALRKNSGTDYDASFAAVHEVPAGGSTGQVLEKNSNTDYDASWTALPVTHSVPAAGTTNQYLGKNSSTDYDIGWKSLPTTHSIPAGGTTGQVLEKNSNTDYDVSWTSPSTTGLLPTGGTVGQVLKKNSSTDYDDNFANLLGTNSESTTTGAIALSLTPGTEIDRVVLTGNPTFSTANRANGLFKSIRIDSNGSSRTIAFESGWVWLGTDNSAGVTLASGKSAVLSLTCYGTNATDIVACYVAQP